MDPAWTAQPNAIDAQLLRAVSARDWETAQAFATALACSVMGSRGVALAAAILAGGPHAIDRALELVELRASARATNGAPAVPVVSS